MLTKKELISRFSCSTWMKNVEGVEVYKLDFPVDIVPRSLESKDIQFISVKTETAFALAQVGRAF